MNKPSHRPSCYRNGLTASRFQRFGIFQTRQPFSLRIYLLTGRLPENLIAYRREVASFSSLKRTLSPNCMRRAWCDQKPSGGGRGIELSIFKGSIYKSSHRTGARNFAKHECPHKNFFDPVIIQPYSSKSTARLHCAQKS